VIIKKMFRLITWGPGAVKEYFLGALPCAAPKRLWMFASKNRSANDLV
jgi:hypothetical protein